MEGATPSPYDFMINFFIVLLALGVSLSDNSYRTTVELTRGAGENQVGLVEEGEAFGPNRLAARSGRLYLLDRINYRVLVYNYTGVNQGKLQIDFYPADLAVDFNGRCYLLENRTDTNFIKVYENDRLVGEHRFAGDVRNPVTGIVVDEQERLVMTKGTGRWFVDSTGMVSEDSGNMNPAWEIIGEDRKGALYSIETIGSKEGNSYRYRRRLLVNDAGRSRLIINELPFGYFNYDFGNRDIAIDEQGNIFQFLSFDDGTAAIVQWYCR